MNIIETIKDFQSTNIEAYGYISLEGDHFLFEVPKQILSGEGYVRFRNDSISNFKFEFNDKEYSLRIIRDKNDKTFKINQLAILIFSKKDFFSFIGQISFPELREEKEPLVPQSSAAVAAAAAPIDRYVQQAAAAAVALQLSHEDPQATFKYFKTAIYETINLMSNEQKRLNQALEALEKPLIETDSINTRSKNNITSRQGKVINQQLQGFGIKGFSHSDPVTVVGIFNDDLLNGIGKVLYRNGTLKIGKFKNDKLNGQGQIFYPNGYIEEGEFVDDKLNGEGLIFDKKNNRFTYGIFSSGNPQEVMVIDFIDQSTLKMNFENKDDSYDYRSTSNGTTYLNARKRSNRYKGCHSVFYQCCEKLRAYDQRKQKLNSIQCMEALFSVPESIVNSIKSFIEGSVELDKKKFKSRLTNLSESVSKVKLNKTKKGDLIYFIQEGKNYLDGPGMISYPESSPKMLEKGFYTNGQLQGLGIISYKDNKRLVATFNRGLLSGIVEYLYPNGQYFLGTYDNNKKSGGGYEYFGNFIIQGTFKEDYFCMGVKIDFEMGTIDIGDFQDYQLHGAGIRFDQKTQIVFKGEFEKGKAIDGTISSDLNIIKQELMFLLKI